MISILRLSHLLALLCLTTAGATSANNCANGKTHFIFQDYGVNVSWHSAPAYFMTVDLERGLVFSEDYGEPFEACNTEERVSFDACIKSFAFDFAIPRRYEITEDWNFNGRHYRKIDSIKLSALGTSEQVDRIVSESQGKKYVYYYSPENGLRALVLPREFKDVAQSFLSTDEMGPFAICKDS
jgi:hypothetical protein